MKQAKKAKNSNVKVTFVMLTQQDLLHYWCQSRVKMPPCLCLNMGATAQHKDVAERELWSKIIPFLSYHVLRARIFLSTVQQKQQVHTLCTGRNIWRSWPDAKPILHNPRCCQSYRFPHLQCSVACDTQWKILLHTVCSILVFPWISRAEQCVGIAVNNIKSFGSKPHSD